MENNNNNNVDEIVTLNVGGTLFTTTKTTLMKGIKPTMLSVMFGGNYTPGLMKDGNIFIDREPEAFAYILRYLRTGKKTPAEPPMTEEIIDNEFVYFGLISNEDIQRKNEAVNKKRKIIESVLNDNSLSRIVKRKWYSEFKDYVALNSKLFTRDLVVTIIGCRTQAVYDIKLTQIEDIELQEFIKNSKRLEAFQDYIRTDISAENVIIEKNGTGNKFAINIGVFWKE
jgi:tellurite resistance protein